MSQIADWEVEEVMAVALGLEAAYEKNCDACVEELERLFDEDPLDMARKLVMGLLPMAFMGNSSISNVAYQGFGKIDKNGTIMAILQKEVNNG